MSGQAEFWDERYRGDGFAFGSGANAFLEAQSQYLRPGALALVPGDGQGRNGVWLAEQGLIVDTVDISPLGVEKAKALAASRGVSINAQVADLSTWDWPRDTYDVVAAIYVHFLDADRPTLHRAMVNALKPGGVLILEAFNIGQLDEQKVHGSGGPKIEEMLYSVAKLKSDFAGENIVLLEDVLTDLNEGHRHKGRASIVRALVQRT